MDNSGKSALGLDPNVAAGLAYLPICAVNLIMSIIILVTDKTNKLARFHAMQSLLLMGAAIVGYIVVWILTMIIVVGAGAMNMPSLGILGFLLLAVYGIGLLAAVVISCIKAFQGEMFKLPVIGNMADNWSN
jgi:uncharacterized membrane protein